MINRETMALIYPRCPADKAEIYSGQLSASMREGGIDSVTRAAAFLGQLGVESGELRYMRELGDGERYEGRLDLGNTQKGDGPRFVGRGPIQLTGRANYKMAGESMGLPLEAEPELAEDSAIGFRVAAWYWVSHGCNELADELDYRAITKAINGGYTHHDTREAYYHRALEVLGVFALL